MTRRAVPGIALVAIASLLAYSRWVEPKWIEVNHYRFSAEVDRTLKIVHLSDLHTYEYGAREKRLIVLVAKENPDAILISGDTIANEGDWDKVRILLSRLHAPLGVFLVRGNWEHWRPDPNEIKIYENSGVVFLNNDAHPIDKKVWVVGFDDSLAGRPDEKSAFSSVPSSVFKIGLFHSPSYFDSVASRIDLALAGHTHGGQLRIPFLPPFWLPKGSGPYVESWYRQGSSRMYVSRGVGNSILEMRFACRPEIAVFQIEPAKNSLSPNLPRSTAVQAINEQ